MSKATLTVGQIRGLLLIAAKNDVRYYLNGVKIEFDTARAVATNGHALLAINVSTDLTDIAFSSVIVPRQSLEAIARSGKPHDSVDIICSADGLQLARSDGVSVTAAQVENSFPDYMHVIPQSLSGEATQVDPELLNTLSKALLLCLGAKKSSVPTIGHNGTSPAILFVDGFQDKALGLIMPCHTTGDASAAVTTFLAN